MYRSRNGKRSFSFSRLMVNAFPNFASDSAGFVEITPQRQDMLYAHQLATPSPEILDEHSFYVAGVCDRERQSERIHSALLKNGCLTPSGDVDTSKIGPKFIHQMAFIAQQSQKNLVNVLFFWEEEVQRLRKLNLEEQELDALITQAEERDSGHGSGQENLDQLKFARERVLMKKRQRPSQRDPSIEADTDMTVAAAFEARDATSAAPADLPPAYAGPGVVRI